VGDRRARPRLVVAGRCRQHGVRHVGDQQPPFKQPTPGIYGNDFIAEMRAQGLSSAEINTRLRARDNEVPEESDEIRYMVYAFNAETGALKWEREAHKGLPFGGRHRKNTYASETPFTDGERVYVSFGLNIGLFAYTLNGDLVWKRTWPPQPIYLDFGTGTSPDRPRRPRVSPAG
jgi:hypothetical protein